MNFISRFTSTYSWYINIMEMHLASLCHKVTNPILAAYSKRFFKTLIVCSSFKQHDATTKFLNNISLKRTFKATYVTQCTVQIRKFSHCSSCLYSSKDEDIENLQGRPVFIFSPYLLSFLFCFNLIHHHHHHFNVHFLPRLIKGMDGYFLTT